MSHHPKWVLDPYWHGWSKSALNGSTANPGSLEGFAAAPCRGVWLGELSTAATPTAFAARSSGLALRSLESGDWFGQEDLVYL